MENSFLAVLMKIGQSKRTRSGKLMSKRKSWMFILLIGVIIVAGGVTVSHLFEQAKQRTACMQILTINDAVELFAIENKKLPDDLRTLCDTNNPSEKIYLEWEPIDPWGNPYFYQVSKVSGYQLMSLGADGQQGGKGEAEDISLNDAKAEIREREKG